MKINETTNDLLDVKLIIYYTGINRNYTEVYSEEVDLIKSNELYTAQTSLCEFNLQMIDKFLPKVMTNLSLNTKRSNLIMISGSAALKIYVPRGITKISLQDKDRNELFYLVNQTESEWNKVPKPLYNDIVIYPYSGSTITESMFERVVIIYNHELEDIQTDDSGVKGHILRQGQHQSQLSYTWYDLGDGFMLPELVLNNLCTMTNGEVLNGVLLSEDYSKCYLGGLTSKLSR